MMDSKFSGQRLFSVKSGAAVQKGLINSMMKYEPCGSYGGEVIDSKPSYIPLGEDKVLEIIDQTCTKCGAVIIGENQRTRQIVNKKAHDKLIELLEKRVR